MTHWWLTPSRSAKFLGRDAAAPGGHPVLGAGRHLGLECVGASQLPCRAGERAGVGGGAEHLGLGEPLPGGDERGGLAGLPAGDPRQHLSLRWHAPDAMGRPLNPPPEPPSPDRRRWALGAGPLTDPTVDVWSGGGTTSARGSPRTS